MFVGEAHSWLGGWQGSEGGGGELLLLLLCGWIRQIP
jgi:hypothetical protein